MDISRARRGMDRASRRQARKLAGLNEPAHFIRRLAADEQVRREVGRAAGRAGTVRRDLKGADLGSLARDPKLQEHVAALLRAVTAVLDAGVDVGRRRAKRRVGTVIVLGSVSAGLAFLGFRQLRRVDGSPTQLRWVDSSPTPAAQAG
jgi:hypothetical protein